MTNHLKLKDAFVAIHGHFYQPPRENPWFDIIETEESAYPFHDWNERITFECYRPNAYARIVDSKRKILDIVNNYSSISFNFGPTLLLWLEKRFPDVYQKILEADREGVNKFGHGNALAQTYDHIIMPLANERDKETEILWGIADFEKRFHRRPEAMWLPETAVDYPTLQVLIRHGMSYLILSPFQALRVRTLGGKRWVDVSQGRIETTQPYRCFMKDTSGRKVSDQSIDLFFYDGMISKEVSFGDLLKDGNAFCEQFGQAYQQMKKRPQLIHIATDGETYGHHKKFGDMALAYALREGFPSKGFEVINYGAFLKRVPPVYEVEIDEGPKGEGTSWSCSHGVDRWKEDCGCSTGGRAGWNQKWRKPLRDSLDLLREELSLIFEKEGEKVFKDVWEARNGYIDVILNRSSENLNRFFDRYGLKGLDSEGKVKGIKLLEMERHALQMYTSCGWFFADLSGLETIIILQHASRAMELAREMTSREVERMFLNHLSEAHSNLPEMGDGKQVYQRLVKPRAVTLNQVVNHYAISSQLGDKEKERKIFSYRVETIHEERMEKENHWLILGEVRVTSDTIPEPKEFFFGLIPSTKDIFRTWISEDRKISFDRLKEKSFQSIGGSEDEMAETLTSLFGNLILTIRETFKGERQAIFNKLIEKEIKEHLQGYADLFDKTKGVIEVLAKEGLEIPYEIRVAAEVTLSDRLLREVKELKKDFEATVKREQIDRIVEEAREHGFQLRKEEPIRILNEMLNEKMEALQRAINQNPVELRENLQQQEERIEEVIQLIDLAEKWGFELPKEESQNLMGEILTECVGSLEACWWGNGAEIKSISPKFVMLAEKLDFNVEKVSKIITPAISKSLL